ncbi:MAG: hypothetical protein WCI27_02195 [Candidatus Omnitrophota bacterium]
MRRLKTYWVSTTLMLTYLFLARDTLKPSAVTGATRKVTPLQLQSVLPRPQQTFSQLQDSSLPPPMAAAVVKSSLAAVPLDPGQSLVSSAATPPVTRVVMPDPEVDRAGCRTFKGQVASVVAEGSGDDPRQFIELVTVSGEHFKCVLNSGTRVYAGDDHTAAERSVVPGDRLFVKYMPEKENTAVEVTIE